MNELLHSFFESMSTSVSGVTRRTRLTADNSPGWRNRGRDAGMWWEMERRTMGRDMFEVEMAGREENLLGVGVVGRFCCSLVAVVVVVVVVAVSVSSQPTEAERPRLKSLLKLFLLRGKRRFLAGALGEGFCSWSGEAPWTSVEVGLALIVCGEVVLGCVVGSVNKSGENRERAEGRQSSRGVLTRESSLVLGIRGGSEGITWGTDFDGWDDWDGWDGWDGWVLKWTWVFGGGFRGSCVASIRRGRAGRGRSTI
jgi:hypothetical protein